MPVGEHAQGDDQGPKEMSIPNGGEEKALTLSELRALAEEYARQQDELASKARGRANQARAKRRKCLTCLKRFGWRLAGRK